jgi:hypothetical protein
MNEESNKGEINETGTEQVAGIELPKEIKEKKKRRPLKFKTIKKLQSKIDKYFKDTPKDEWTITGLAMALDTYRQTLCNYEEKDEFVDTIKKAKQKVENGYEIDLKKSGRSGTIFALKNFGWTDRSETDLTTKGESLNNISYERAKGIITGGERSDKSNITE